MNDADRDRMKTKIGRSLRADMRCASCNGSPSCPQLTDEVWELTWNRFHRAAEIDHTMLVRPLVCSMPVRCVQLPAGRHASVCEMTRQSVRQLLCLECAETALGRPLTLGDLESCLGNYPHYVMQERARWLTLSSVGALLGFTDPADTVADEEIRVAESVIHLTDRVAQMENTIKTLNDARDSFEGQLTRLQHTHASLVTEVLLRVRALRDDEATGHDPPHLKQRLSAIVERLAPAAGVESGGYPEDAIFSHCGAIGFNGAVCTVQGYRRYKHGREFTPLPGTTHDRGLHRDDLSNEEWKV